MGKNMKIMLTVVTALITGLFFSSSAIAEDVRALLGKQLMKPKKKY